MYQTSYAYLTDVSSDLEDVVVELPWSNSSVSIRTALSELQAPRYATVCPEEMIDLQQVPLINLH